MADRAFAGRTKLDPAASVRCRHPSVDRVGVRGQRSIPFCAPLAGSRSSPTFPAHHVVRRRIGVQGERRGPQFVRADSALTVTRYRTATPSRRVDLGRTRPSGPPAGTRRVVRRYPRFRRRPVRIGGLGDRSPRPRAPRPPIPGRPRPRGPSSVARMIRATEADIYRSRKTPRRGSTRSRIRDRTAASRSTPRPGDRRRSRVVSPNAIEVQERVASRGREVEVRVYRNG